MKGLLQMGFVCLLGLCAGCVSTSAPPKTVSNVDNYDGLPAKALAYNPKAAGINTELGLSYLSQGDEERAKDKLLLAQKQDPDSSDVKGAFAYYYDKIGNDKEAEKYYKSALSAAKSKGSSANNYGVFLCKEKRYNEADKYFLMAIADPQYVKTAEAYENMGLCAVDRGDKTAAKNYFTKALRVKPGLPTSLYEMADLNFSEDKYEVAQDYLDAYLKKSSPTAQSLWLGIRIADKMNNKDKEASQALMLQHSFPDSKEYQHYLVMKSA